MLNKVLRRDIVVCFLLVIVTVCPYWQVKNHEFIEYDDPAYVTDNEYVKSGLSLKNIRWAFTTTECSNWHPVTWMSHMLDCQLFGMNAGAHHLMNLFFHLINTLMLFLLFRRMSGDVWPSAFVAGLFAVHPLHVESVAWIAERKDVLSAFFWMLTMWCYVRYVERPGAMRYLGAILCYIVGLMAKPMLVTLPFVLILMDYWPMNRFQIDKPGIARLLMEKMPFFVLCAVSSVVTLYAQQAGGAISSIGVHPIPVRIGNAVVAYAGYLIKVFWPGNLAIVYPHPGMPAIWQVVAAGSMLILVTGLAAWSIKKSPYIAVGWLWYLGTLVPVIGLVQVGLQSMADRYTYIPIIGVFIIIAWGVHDMIAPRRRVRAWPLLPMAGTALLIILMSCAWMQLRYWKNSVRLFEHALNINPKSYALHTILGYSLSREGKIDQAITHYKKAIDIDPGFPYTHYYLANIFARKGELTDAVRHYKEAIGIKPGYALAHYNLGLVLMKQGKTEEAAEHFSEVLKIEPDNRQARLQLDRALSRNNRIQ